MGDGDLDTAAGWVTVACSNKEKQDMLAGFLVLVAVSTGTGNFILLETNLVDVPRLASEGDTGGVIVQRWSVKNAELFMACSMEPGGICWQVNCVTCRRRRSSRGWRTSLFHMFVKDGKEGLHEFVVVT